MRSYIRSDHTTMSCTSTQSSIRSRPGHVCVCPRSNSAEYSIRHWKHGTVFTESRRQIIQKACSIIYHRREKNQLGYRGKTETGEYPRQKGESLLPSGRGRACQSTGTERGPYTVRKQRGKLSDFLSELPYERNEKSGPATWMRERRKPRQILTNRGGKRLSSVPRGT